MVLSENLTMVPGRAIYLFNCRATFPDPTFNYLMMYFQTLKIYIFVIIFWKSYFSYLQ